jgi:pimeloyl-ACP methyl ester carboxylesterase
MEYRTARPQPRLRVALQNGDPAMSGNRGKAVALSVAFSFLVILTMLAGACQPPTPQPPPQVTIEPLNFQISSGEDHYQIEGYFAHSAEPGRMPALLVLNGDGGDAHQCIVHALQFAVLQIRLACISLPGYGKSSGPSRFVGPQSIEAARRGLDLVAARPEVDPSRLAIWGIADGAVAAGLLMDSDRRVHAVILQSGAYDLLKLWPGAPIGTKLSILRQVWPNKLDCNVLILHGKQDHKTPVTQAEQLAKALRAHGAHVETHFFTDGDHSLGKKVNQPLRDFLRANLTLPSTDEDS